MAKVTPSRQQYLDFKAQFPDAIVMFRLGDFYEMFDDDAHTAARELDLVLTSRPVSKGERVPMCGVPHHAVEGYIAKLVERGYHVAVIEQVGSAPVNGLTPREVSRVITPGTVMEPAMLADTQHNYLLALAPEPDRSGESWLGVGLAYVDISTGEFAATQIAGEEATLAVVEELARLGLARMLRHSQIIVLSTGIPVSYCWRILKSRRWPDSDCKISRSRFGQPGQSCRMWRRHNAARWRN